MKDRRSIGSLRQPLRPRRRTSKSNSLLVKHYALFHSLSRYAVDDPQSLPRRRTSKSAQVPVAQEKRARRLKERYPAAKIWSYSWPLPLARLSEGEDVEDVVKRIVKETFDEEYDKFRSPQWGKKHRITQDHRERILVDYKEVEESAVAANTLVKTALNRFLSGVKKGNIGNPEKPATHADEVESGLDQEIWGEHQYELEWKGLLEYMRATAGSSKTAQWRNWHLLEAVAKTRRRCEELFGHQS